MNIENKIVEFAKQNMPNGFTATWTNDKELKHLKPTDEERYIVAYSTIYKFRKNGTLYYKNRGELKYLPYIGGWYDAENECYIVEAVFTFKHLSNAMLVAELNDQRYIFDLKEKRDISVRSYRKYQSLLSEKDSIVKALDQIYTTYMNGGIDIEETWYQKQLELKRINKRIELLKNQEGI